jgi:hypothetical protein
VFWGIGGCRNEPPRLEGCSEYNFVYYISGQEPGKIIPSLGRELATERLKIDI